MKQYKNRKRVSITRNIRKTTKNLWPGVVELTENHFALLKQYF